MADTTLRADAARNRERLLAVAREAFTSSSAQDVTLEGIARDAGVGIGTLYRHFPTRDALVEAVYRAELAELCAQAPRLLARRRPDRALRAWMDRFADYVATKRALGEVLRSVIASGAVTTSQARRELAVAVGTLLEAGVADGTLRADVRAEDVVVMVVAAFVAAGDDRAQAARLLDLVLDAVTVRAHAR